MARLGQHKAWDTMPSSGEHIKQVVLGSGMLNLVGIKVKALPPELSFQFQAEVFGAQALLIGVITQGVKHEIYIHTHSKGGVPAPSHYWGIEAIIYL